MHLIEKSVDAEAYASALSSKWDSKNKRVLCKSLEAVDGDLDNFEKNFWGTKDERVRPSRKVKEAETREGDVGNFDFTNYAGSVHSEGSSGTTTSSRSVRTRADYDKSNVIDDMAMVAPGASNHSNSEANVSQGGMESRSAHHGAQDNEDREMEEASGMGSASVHHRTIPVTNVVDDKMLEMSMKSDFAAREKAAIAAERRELSDQREALMAAMDEFKTMKAEFEAMKAAPPSPGSTSPVSEGRTSAGANTTGKHSALALRHYSLSANVKSPPMGRYTILADTESIL